MKNQQIDLFTALSKINGRPELWESYTAEMLWNDKHISKNMLASHLDKEGELATRPHDFIERSALWIVEHFGLDKNKSVADYGCGPGLYAARFAAAGANVTGIDFSSRSIAYAIDQAEQMGQSINYVDGDYLNYQPETNFDLITLIYCDLCALNPGQRKTLLTKFAASLADGGSVLLDAFSINAYNDRREASTFGDNLMGGFWSPDRYWGFLNTFKYEEAKVILDKYDIVELAQTREVFNWLQYFTGESLAKELSDCGLQVVECYADVAGTPTGSNDPVLAVIAQKL